MVDKIKLSKPISLIARYAKIDAAFYKRCRCVGRGTKQIDIIVVSTHIPVHQCDFIDRNWDLKARIICYSRDLIALKRCNVSLNRFVNKTDKVSDLKFHMCILFVYCLCFMVLMNALYFCLLIRVRAFVYYNRGYFMSIYITKGSVICFCNNS